MIGQMWCREISCFLRFPNRFDLPVTYPKLALIPSPYCTQKSRRQNHTSAFLFLLYVSIRFRYVEHGANFCLFGCIGIFDLFLEFFIEEIAVNRDFYPGFRVPT